ncbi:MAG TPA: cellulase family glycosylhydrolase [Verrucomicrobiae bacterium]|nr:cellulase family glycosylhydrolase [Verrucomicrobiae bacterium]
MARTTAHPSQYERVDFAVRLRAPKLNPYRQEEVRLDLNLTAPAGGRVRVPAFFERDAEGGVSVWDVRFAPAEAGRYAGQMDLTLEGAPAGSAPVELLVERSSAKGFLRPANAWSFRFDNGEPFRGIGENIGWESRQADNGGDADRRYNYEYLLGKLAAAGGNFFRTWMCPWNLPLEWKRVNNTDRYRDDPGALNASAMRRMDELVELAEARDLYLMLTLNNSGDLQGREWRRNSYNKINGGPVTEPQAFFTDAAARAQFKNRLRYLVARWGYSPHLAAWEFFNEIDNLMYGLPQPIPDRVVTAWHREMGEYLKSIDPYQHMVTTSISHREVAGLYEIPALDFNQLHIYGHNGVSRTGTFATALRADSSRDGKPFVVGEFGFEWDWNKNFDDVAPQMSADFKKGLWLGAFSPTPILPMSWWWEYFDRREVTPYLQRVRSLVDRMQKAGGGSYAEAACDWSGATPPLAVRCGETYFVLLSNDSRSEISGAVSLPALTGTHKVEAYRPETGLTEEWPRLAGGVIPDVAVAATNYLALIISPEASSGGAGR